MSYEASGLTGHDLVATVLMTMMTTMMMMMMMMMTTTMTMMMIMTTMTMMMMMMMTINFLVVLITQDVNYGSTVDDASRPAPTPTGNKAADDHGLRGRVGHTRRKLLRDR